MVRVLEAASVGRYKIYAALSYLILAKERKELNYASEAARDLASIGIDEESIKDFLSRSVKTPLARECLVSRVGVEWYLRALTDFYAHNGYEPSGVQPDHPAIMLAFTAHLIKKEIEEPKERMTCWRLQHRFIKTYLIGALKCLALRAPCRFTEATLNVIRVDLNLLFETLTCK